MSLVTVLGPYLLVAGLAAAWALAEIVQTFHSDIRRALKTGWSNLFIGVNLAFALLIYFLVRSLAPPSANPWLLALAAGAGWQALLRSRVNLLQPLNPDAGGTVSLSLADLYGRLQEFCRDQIDRSLAAERIRLLERASRVPLEELERQLRLHAHASVLHPPEEVESYIERLRQYDPERRALLLASCLLRLYGYALLQERLKAMEKHGERPRLSPRAPLAQQPADRDQPGGSGSGPGEAG